MSFSSKITRPFLIYDDRCPSCIRFARTMVKLSGGWIYMIGHYYSLEAINLKNMVFPSSYDSTKMFWLVNKRGAYGGRAGLFQVIAEIFVGIGKSFFRSSNGLKKNLPCDKDLVKFHCEYSQSMQCMSRKDILYRILGMIKNSDKFYFD